MAALTRQIEVLTKQIPRSRRSRRIGRRVTRMRGSLGERIVRIVDSGRADPEAGQGPAASRGEDYGRMCRHEVSW